MIVDAEALRPRQRDRVPAARTPRTARSSPSSWSRCSRSPPTPRPTRRQAGEQLRALRAQVRRTAPGARPDHRLGGHPSVRDVGGPADRRAPALPRAGHARCASSRARSSSSACTSTSASTTPTRPSTSPTACACTSPVLLALSANSPFWRADATGLLSTRTPIFRAFPRVGIPPHYARLGALRERDRVHGRVGRRWRTTRGSGTTCARTRTSARSRSGCATRRRAWSTRSRWPRSSRRWSRSSPSTSTRAAALGAYPWQMLDENKWLAARHGLDGELVDLPSQRARGHQGAGAPALRPPARARPGPRLGRPSSRRSTTCSSAATAPSARWSSTRPTTTCARSWPRSWRRRRRRTVGGVESATSSPSGGSGSRPPAACACRCCPAGGAPAACRSGSS